MPLFMDEQEGNRTRSESAKFMVRQVGMKIARRANNILG